MIGLFQSDSHLREMCTKVLKSSTSPFTWRIEENSSRKGSRFNPTRRSHHLSSALCMLHPPILLSSVNFSPQPPTYACNATRRDAVLLAQNSLFFLLFAVSLHIFGQIGRPGQWQKMTLAAQLRSLPSFSLALYFSPTPLYPPLEPTSRCARVHNIIIHFLTTQPRPISP